MRRRYPNIERAQSFAKRWRRDVGVVSLSENTCSVIPAPTLASAAGAFRIRGWRALDAQKFDDAKGQIHAGNPVVFGMDISESFENLSGDTVYDDTKSPRIGGHAMVLVGYSERRQAFKVMNSWGTDWGDKGFGWVSYRALRELSDRLFVMDVAPPDPVTLVLPTPVPLPVVAPTPSPVTPPRPVVAPPVPVVVVPTPEPPKPAPVVVVKPEPPKPVAIVPPEPPKPAPVVIAVPPTPVVAPPKPAPVVITPPAPPKPVVVAPPKPAPPPPIATVQREINARLSQVSCARLEGTLASDRRLRLRGFAGSSDDLAKLRTDLSALTGVAQVDSDATLLPWPQCEVQLSFDEALAAGKALSINLRGGQGNTFREGDSLAIEVITPSYPSYLYVSYLQANGEVAHLAWPQRNRPVAPNTRLVFGGGGAQPVYRVSGPFGDEAIVVVASASPLFQEDLPETATDREYLTTFRRAFLTRPQSGGGQRTVAATVAPLKTLPGK